MADKEIGLMQIRTGKQRNLPSALEHGELAFTTDECRMFVGAPSVVTPASLVAGRTKNTVPGSAEENVEILTEFTPAHVMNRALYRAVKFDIPASGSFKLAIPSADRLFLDYVAFDPVSSATRILETGTIQIIILDKSIALLSQQNNTNQSDGIVHVEADTNDGAVTVSDSLTQITLVNSHTKPMRFEYIYRGWQEPL